MPPLNSCCRCCTLRTGTIVSGVCGILLAVFGIIVMFTTSVKFRTIIIDTLPDWAVKLILAINMAMTILISVLLIVGALKRNMFLMLPWVMLGILLAIGLLASVIYTSVVFYLDGDSFNGNLWLIVGLVALVIYMYMWLVVYSYFVIVKEEYDRGAYMKAPFRRG